MRESRFFASNGVAGDYLGWSVAVDGDFVLAGAWRDPAQGRAYVFENAGGTWTETELIPTDPVYLSYGDSVPDEVHRTREQWRQTWAKNEWSHGRGQ